MEANQEHYKVLRGYCADETAETLSIEQYDKSLFCFSRSELIAIIPLEPVRRQGKTYSGYYVNSDAEIQYVDSVKEMGDPS
jgi:hypothetical protein